MSHWNDEERIEEDDGYDEWTTGLIGGLTRNNVSDTTSRVWHISLTTRHRMDVSVVNRLASRVSAVHTNVETPHGCILLNYLVSQSDQ
jgi:hypothetical protein